MALKNKQLYNIAKHINMAFRLHLEHQLYNIAKHIIKHIKFIWKSQILFYLWGSIPRSGGIASEDKIPSGSCESVGLLLQILAPWFLKGLALQLLLRSRMFQISLPLSFSHNIVVLFVDVVNPSSRPYAPAFKTQFWNGKCQWQYNPYTPSTCVVSQCCSAPGLTLWFFHCLTNMMMTTPHPTQYPFMLNIPQWLTGKTSFNRMVYDVYGVCWFAYNLRTS